MRYKRHGKRRRLSFEHRHWHARHEAVGLPLETHPECRGKQAHPDFGAAMQTARKLFTVEGGDLGALAVFRCDHCGHYHIGHRVGVLRSLPQ